jgi:hypothetical protein
MALCAPARAVKKCAAGFGIPYQQFFQKVILRRCAGMSGRMFAQPIR